jgi:hypothetical protein
MHHKLIDTKKDQVAVAIKLPGGGADSNLPPTITA